MATYIPFGNLEVGKSYYLQSRYWHEVLGVAKVIEIDLFSGTGEAEVDWNPNPDGTKGRITLEADWGWMWTDMPTKEEQRARVEEAWHEKYTPPRKYEGVVYTGKFPIEWQKVLDELALKIKQTIIYDQRFKMDGRGGFFIWESKLDYNLSGALIRPTGECDWDSIAYLEKQGLYIHAGERDSCGWLTGVIELKDAAIHKKILYG